MQGDSDHMGKSDLVSPERKRRVRKKMAYKKEGPDPDDNARSSEFAGKSGSARNRHGKKGFTAPRRKKKKEASEKKKKKSIDRWEEHSCAHLVSKKQPNSSVPREEGKKDYSEDIGKKDRIAYMRGKAADPIGETFR